MSWRGAGVVVAHDGNKHLWTVRELLEQALQTAPLTLEIKRKLRRIRRWSNPHQLDAVYTRSTVSRKKMFLYDRVGCTRHGWCASQSYDVPYLDRKSNSYTFHVTGALHVSLLLRFLQFA